MEFLSQRLTLLPKLLKTRHFRKRPDPDTLRAA
jgi:hypothetical protein